MEAHRNTVIFDGIFEIAEMRYRQGAAMALTDTFVKQVKPIKPSGDKYADGGGMYLVVKESGKYWRMDYRYLGRRRTLALGVYPEVSIVKARKRREAARELLADGQDPGQAKCAEKMSKINAAAHTFEAVAREWLKKRLRLAHLLLKKK